MKITLTRSLIVAAAAVMAYQVAVAEEESADEPVAEEASGEESADEPVAEEVSGEESADEPVVEEVSEEATAVEPVAEEAAPEAAPEAETVPAEPAGAPEVGAGETADEPRPPLTPEMWAQRPNIARVTLSPSGKYLAMLRTPPKEGNPTIEVFNTEDLSIVMRQNSDPMEIQGYDWISDYTLIFGLRQKVRDDIEGFNQGVWAGRLRIVDVEEKKVKALGGTDTSLASVLPNQPDHVLIRTFSGGENASRGAAFRPESFWKHNLKTGHQTLIVRSKIDKRGMRFDPDGAPLFAQGYNRTKLSYVDYWRKPGTRGWKAVHSSKRDDLETFSIEGLDPLNPNHLIVRAHNDGNTIGLWTYDPGTKEFLEPLYLHPKLDVLGTITHSNTWKHPQVITGFVIAEDTVKRKFFDSEERAVYEHLQETVPNAGFISISSRSQDGDSLVIYNRGPADPGTYYLLHKGVLRAIGSLAPQIASADLSSVEYITYTSRDGKTTIPAYVTRPKGDPPFPLVVMPHGGPWVTEIVIYDAWSQMLANHGYMVIQPQYRGSQNYGLDFWLASFEDGSQMGFAMQDDKDDGALYLVERGDVDPNRMAMMGWSYGGYASLVAASRTPQIYQCVIAAAAPSDPVHQVNFWRHYSGVRGQFRDRMSKAHELAISPVDEAEKVNIPILLIHGEVDQRVPLVHADMYLKALKKYNKPHEYLLLEGADHFSNTLTYDHLVAYYSRSLNFLAKKCGPEGL